MRRAGPSGTIAHGRRGARDRQQPRDRPSAGQTAKIVSERGFLSSASTAPDSQPQALGVPRARPAAAPWRLPIALYLAVGFGGLVAAAVGTVLWLSLDTARDNTYELLRRNAELGITALIHDIGAHLDPVRRHVQSIAELLQAGQVPLDDDRRLGDLLLGAASGARQITGFAFVDDHLHAVRAGHLDGRQAVSESVGSWIDRPEVRLAIRSARTETGVHWGDLIHIDGLGAQLTLRQSVQRDGAFAGVLIAAVSLAKLSDILGDGPLATLGRPFILRGRNEVLALPDQDKSHYELSADHPLPDIGAVGDPVLAGMWGPESADARRVLGDSAVQGRIVKVAGKDYVFLYREVTTYGSTPDAPGWLVGYYVALEKVDAPLERLIVAGAAGIAILLLSILLAALLGRALGRPIRRLARAAEAVHRLEIEGTEPLPGSRFREIDTACRAYNSMLAGLLWFETYVPKALVALLMARGQRAQLSSELREVTVMFTDIVGFTGIGERLSAPQLAEFLNRHFALLSACIEAEGGTIDKYIGDSVMAFWGAPESQPDHALRACRAVRAIAAALAADNHRRAAKGLHAVRLRVGIHTGPAIVGNIGAPGRINYTLIGDTVNVSQRLEQLGKRFDTGEGDLIALISARTAAELPAELAPEPLGAIELRGRGEATEVYRLV